MVCDSRPTTARAGCGPVYAGPERPTGAPRLSTTSTWPSGRMEGEGTSLASPVTRQKVVTRPASAGSGIDSSYDRDIGRADSGADQGDWRAWKGSSLLAPTAPSQAMRFEGGRRDDRGGLARRPGRGLPGS